MSDTYRSGSGGGSIIGSGLRINGDVISDGDLQIDGKVVGDVKSRTLNLGDTGEVDGGIVADQLQVGGKVVGQIKARTVNLARTARVEGDILHETLSVEAGAFIEGRRRSSIPWLLVAGVFLGAATLSKESTLLFLALPVAEAAWWPWAGRRRLFGEMAAVYGAFAATTAWWWIFLAVQTGNPIRSTLASASSGSFEVANVGTLMLASAAVALAMLTPLVWRRTNGALDASAATSPGPSFTFSVSTIVRAIPSWIANTSSRSRS